jgi:hypothetical protein
MTLPRCPHCRKRFHPEPHNAWHQRCCTGKAYQQGPPTSAIIWHCLKTIDLVYFHPYSGCRSQESPDMSLGMRLRSR